ncbi:hypothetical protein [Breoghania sp.]|uniref:hypothetical protein n=1 Tax=Breoghania sp. TaxID=2065378 RepID=UPI002AAB71E9|nr:hypothetical protein [Breoghania sp.]
MIVRMLVLALIAAPTLGGCAAVAVTGAVVGGTAKIATTAVGTTVGATTSAVGLVIPDGDDEEDAES